MGLTYDLKLAAATVSDTLPTIEGIGRTAEPMPSDLVEFVKSLPDGGNAKLLTVEVEKKNQAVAQAAAWNRGATREGHAISFVIRTNREDGIVTLYGVNAPQVEKSKSK